MRIRRLLLNSPLFALLIALNAEAEAPAAPDYEDVSTVTEFLFVQNAGSGRFENGRLSLADSGPIIFFSDRPYRIFGHTQLPHFIESWNSGADDSFANNPPNAVLSILGDKVSSFGVVLSNPRYEEGRVSYSVEVEAGNIPSEFGPASLFIDNEAWAAVGGLVVGRGMSRREHRREAQAYAAGKGSAMENQNTYYQAAHAQAAPTSGSAEQQLAELKELQEKGLISQQDYDQKKQQILQQL